MSTAISYLFRASRTKRPILLLGAGASYSSGIPLAEDAVKEIAKAAFARDSQGQDVAGHAPSETDVMGYLQAQPWFIKEPARFGENFPLAVKHWLSPRAFRRQFFERMVTARRPSGAGYQQLADMMRRGLCRTVLTTNFDRLMAQALRTVAIEPLEINRTADDLVRFDAFDVKAQIVYLHGAVEFYRDRNDDLETESLDDRLVDKLRPFLEGCPLIVVGYRGAERSIMHYLLSRLAASCNNYPEGIFWCLLKGEAPHPHVIQLQDAVTPNLRFIEIAGFDELFAELNQELQAERIAPHSEAPEIDTGAGTQSPGWLAARLNVRRLHWGRSRRIALVATALAVTAGLYLSIVFSSRLRLERAYAVGEAVAFADLAEPTELTETFRRTLIDARVGPGEASELSEALTVAAAHENVGLRVAEAARLMERIDSALPDRDAPVARLGFAVSGLRRTLDTWDGLAARGLDPRVIATLYMLELTDVLRQPALAGYPLDSLRSIDTTELADAKGRALAVDALDTGMQRFRSR